MIFIGTDDWDELLAAGEAVDRATGGGPRCRRLDFDDPINIQYTSGTTGFPKGATLSHHNILNNGYFVAEGCRLHRPGPRLHPRALLPLLRHGAWATSAARRTAPHGRAGARVRAPRPPSRRSQAERCTSLYGVPTMFIAELADPTSPATTCRACAPASWPGRRARSR